MMLQEEVERPPKSPKADRHGAYESIRTITSKGSLPKAAKSTASRPLWTARGCVTGLGAAGLTGHVPGRGRFGTLYGAVAERLGVV